MMKIAPTHLFENIHYMYTPYYNDRPNNTVIDTIVLHNISLPPGEFGSGDVQRLFGGILDFDAHTSYDSLRDLQVSSHLYVERDGAVTQFVPFHLRAWHAGVSKFNGRENFNDFSIGIELEGTDYVPFETKQYEALAKIVKALQKAYPDIQRENIISHSDVAPDRKTDPGPYFCWDTFDCLLNKLPA